MNQRIRLRSMRRAGPAIPAMIGAAVLALGVAACSSSELGAVVFLPSAARVTSLTATVGGPASQPILRATSTIRAVSVALAAADQSAVKSGDRVTITLPDSRTTSGVVSAVETVATLPADTGSGSSGPIVPVTIRPTDPSAINGLDQAPVVVSITDRTVPNVLTVPVTALIALAGGGYAIELVAPDGGHHLERVTPGAFDDAAGLVQVSGPGLEVGQSIVVPGS